MRKYHSKGQGILRVQSYRSSHSIWPCPLAWVCITGASEADFKGACILLQRISTYICMIPILLSAWSSFETYLWHNQQTENECKNSKYQRWIGKVFLETELTDTGSVVENKRKLLKRWETLQWYRRTRNQRDGYCFYLNYHCTTRSFRALEK